MPGAPLLFGTPTSTGPQGLGGSERVAAAAAPLGVAFPSNMSFFVWLVLLGVVLPGFVVGGLKAGGFQFVFRGR